MNFFLYKGGIVHRVWGDLKVQKKHLERESGDVV